MGAAISGAEISGAAISGADLYSPEKVQLLKVCANTLKDDAKVRQKTLEDETLSFMVFCRTFNERNEELQSFLREGKQPDLAKHTILNENLKKASHELYQARCNLEECKTSFAEAVKACQDAFKAWRDATHAIHLTFVDEEDGWSLLDLPCRSRQD